MFFWHALCVHIEEDDDDSDNDDDEDSNVVDDDDAACVDRSTQHFTEQCHHYGIFPVES